MQLVNFNFPSLQRSYLALHGVCISQIQAKVQTMYGRMIKVSVRAGDQKKN